MPAVHTFAIYATVAVFFDFLLQISMFMAILALDQQRYEEGRYEIAYCVKVQPEEKGNNKTGLIQTGFKHYSEFIMM